MSKSYKKHGKVDQSENCLVCYVEMGKDQGIGIRDCITITLKHTIYACNHCPHRSIKVTDNGFQYICTEIKRGNSKIDDITIIPKWCPFRLNGV